MRRVYQRRVERTHVPGFPRGEIQMEGAVARLGRLKSVRVRPGPDLTYENTPRLSPSVQAATRVTAVATCPVAEQTIDRPRDPVGPKNYLLSVEGVAGRAIRSPARESKTRNKIEKMF